MKNKDLWNFISEFTKTGRLKRPKKEAGSVFQSYPFFRGQLLNFRGEGVFLFEVTWIVGEMVFLFTQMKVKR